MVMRSNESTENNDVILEEPNYLELIKNIEPPSPDDFYPKLENFPENK